MNLEMQPASDDSIRYSARKRRFCEARILGSLRVRTVLGVALAVLPALGWCAEASDKGSTAPVGKASAVVQATTTSSKLVGRWRRPDGGYVLEIPAVAPDGQLNARYYNPSPIHVAKSVVTRDGDTLKIYIEMRDRNYPGSAYTLKYDPITDQMWGTYFQAVEQQTFDVSFQRLK